MAGFKFRPMLLFALAVLIPSVACSAPSTPPTAPTPPTQSVVAATAEATPPATAAPTVVAEPTATDASQPAAADTPTAAPTKAPTSAPSPVPTSTPLPTAEPTPEPSGLEALAAAFPQPPQASGDVILLTGRVLDRSGQPLPGAVVEIWQTDANGIYDHPGDRSANARDRKFQSYGHSTVDAEGVYLFRTIVPGRYEPRPRHIHVKVKRDGVTLLTTQFYFEEDRNGLSSEGVFSQAGAQGDRLILQPAGSVEVAGAPTPILANDLVIDMGSGGLTPTPSQAEGPYYPVVSIEDYDNDLTIVP